MPRNRSTTFLQSLTALAAVAMLTACGSGGSSSTPDDGSAPESEASSGGGFCEQYDAAGGTLATPGLFQVAMPADTTISDLSSRVSIFDAATPPSDIATEWTEVRDLYAEAVTIAEGIPDNGPVADPRIFEIVKELDEPTTTIRDYLDTNC